MLHRDYFGRSNASPACSFAPQGLLRPTKCISILLFCSTGIISAGQIHLYLALLLHRDYFRRPDSSLSCSFVPQGLFPPSKCISILLFCSTGIISTGRIHLYLALLLHRDYFAPAKCISILLFCSTGMISAVRIHLYLALLLHRDYFGRSDASLSSSFASQELFPPAECISIFLFCPTGIILPRPDASLSSSFASQGLFPPVGFIPAFLFCYTGIISAGRMHPYPALFHHRDYFRRSDSSLSCSFVPQGLFPPVGCIPSLLFSSTGIISTGRIHLYLLLLFHRDYFGQPNASLIRAPVKYQRPNFYYTGNTRMASADTLCKKLPQYRQNHRQKQSILSLSILYFCRYGDILFW